MCRNVTLSIFEELQIVGTFDRVFGRTVSDISGFAAVLQQYKGLGVEIR